MLSILLVYPHFKVRIVTVVKLRHIVSEFLCVEKIT